MDNSKDTYALDDLPAADNSDSILIRNLGESFFQILDHYTVKRGGKYHHVDGKLTYTSSKSEPVIYAGSLSGVPAACEVPLPNQALAPSQTGPFIFTRAFLAFLKSRSESGQPAHFKSEIWPLMRKEAALAYYESFFKHTRNERGFETFKSRFLVASEEQEETILFENSIGVVNQWLWKQVVKPTYGVAFLHLEGWKYWVTAYLKKYLDQARSYGPRKVALNQLRKLWIELSPIIQHPGRETLTGGIEREDAEEMEFYHNLMSCLAKGPSWDQVERMIASIEGGHLHLVGPRTEVYNLNGDWKVISLDVPFAIHQVTKIIDDKLLISKEKKSEDITK